MTGQNPVVVCGIDDSPGARAALEEPADVLVDEAGQAEGAGRGPPWARRRRKRVHGLSTSLGCVLHAPCPVTVVPLRVPA
jgi:nucleotide-binding universal stress UspA family protein